MTAPLIERASRSVVRQAFCVAAARAPLPDDGKRFDALDVGLRAINDFRKGEVWRGRARGFAGWEAGG